VEKELLFCEEARLKEKLEDIIIGFFDASSPQLSPNTARREGKD